MIKFQKTTLSLLLGVFLLASYNGECSELMRMPQTDKKLFAPRFLINMGVDMLLSMALLSTDDKWTASEFASMFFVNSATGVILFQNYDSMKPFLKTSLFTGGAFAVTEIIVQEIDGGYDGLGLRMLNWFFVMPLIASKTNHIIYLKRYKKRHIELNLLQPTYLSYDRKMVPGVQLIQLNW